MTDSDWFTQGLVLLQSLAKTAGMEQAAQAVAWSLVQHWQAPAAPQRFANGHGDTPAGSQHVPAEEEHDPSPGFAFPADWRVFLRCPHASKAFTVSPATGVGVLLCETCARAVPSYWFRLQDKAPWTPSLVSYSQVKR